MRRRLAPKPLRLRELNDGLTPGDYYRVLGVIDEADEVYLGALVRLVEARVTEHPKYWAIVAKTRSGGVIRIIRGAMLKKEYKNAF